MDLMYACPYCKRVFDAEGAREHNLLIDHTPVCLNRLRWGGKIEEMAQPPHIFPLTRP